MTRHQLIKQIKKKKSFLCIGLDSDLSKIPGFLLEKGDPVFEFNKAIIDETHDLCVAYKPNTAFYECNGYKGWYDLERTIQYIKDNYPDIFVIADAKRGDIGNTSKMYAKAFFENMDCDAITIAPYMGSDSVLPFTEYNNKWIVLLSITSNTGAYDFQYHENKDQCKLYERVITLSKTWADENKAMYVVGATKVETLKGIRDMVPRHFLLIPGIGAQGGSLEEVVKNGITNDCGLLVNASRSIIFPGDISKNFALSARKKARHLQKEMEAYLIKYNII